MHFMTLVDATAHQVHPDHAATLACYEPVSEAEVRARAVVDFADVAMACRMLEGAFGDTVEVTVEQRQQFAQLKWELQTRGDRLREEMIRWLNNLAQDDLSHLQESHPPDTSASLTHAVVPGSEVEGFHTHAIFRAAEEEDGGR
ncbi:hypothetical protein CYMTET_9060 [Cymbomonas tetramitiformis]|uniref:Uncharacterized protein n=1 Tax=Cymbomonas tetramitiformis TaxID=36881 RepID=A0AAE0LFH9_9CHLO|nr:hypothetical protein CYMTET_9060 [Cymbomonas tetramitiformis]